LWKKPVFQSPCMSQFALTRRNQYISSCFSRFSIST
jgi:hypothetical protein